MVLTRNSYVSVGLALLYYAEYFVRAGDKSFCGTLHERHPVLVLVHCQVHLGDCGQSPASKPGHRGGGHTKHKQDLEVTSGGFILEMYPQA